MIFGKRKPRQSPAQFIKSNCCCFKTGDIITSCYPVLILNMPVVTGAPCGIEGEGDNCIIQSTLSEAFVPIIVATSEEGTMGNQSISKLLFDGNKLCNISSYWYCQYWSNFSVNNCTIKILKTTGFIFNYQFGNGTGSTEDICKPVSVFIKIKLPTVPSTILTGRGCLQFGGQNGMLLR